MIQYMFNNEVELGKYISSLDIIPDAFRAISETTLTYELHTSPSGIKVLAFNCSIDYTTRFLNGEFDLVSSENLQVIDFITTKVNPKFLINKAAIELFEELPDDLEELEIKHLCTPLIITGSGLGGYLAILSTLRLQHAVDVEESNYGYKKTKRPICITFGSPLVGDAALQKAISERPQWKSSFLNVVAKKDPVASFFTSKTPYKPFGTYLVCADSGGHSAFEYEEAILAVLDAMSSSNAGNIEIYKYGKVLNSIRRKVLYREGSDLGEFHMNRLTAGITLQFKEVGLLDEISNDLVQKLEDRKTKMIKYRKRFREPTKMLNEMMINMAFIEVYMKSRKEKGGYYACYKNATSMEEREVQSRNTIHNFRLILTRYWRGIVEEINRIPQKESAKLRKRWLYAGTDYRRMVEPLEIADYYRRGNENYIENRPHHYTLLENWFDEDRNNSNPNAAQTNKTSVLTYDSCFWAYVEESVASLKDLEGGSSHSATDITQGLEMFRGNLQRALSVVRSRWIDA